MSDAPPPDATEAPPKKRRRRKRRKREGAGAEPSETVRGGGEAGTPTPSGEATTEAARVGKAPPRPPRPGSGPRPIVVAPLPVVEPWLVPKPPEPRPSPPRAPAPGSTPTAREPRERIRRDTTRAESAPREPWRPEDRPEATPEEVAERVHAGLDRLVRMVLREAGLPPASQLGEAHVVVPIEMALGVPDPARAKALVQTLRERLGAALDGATAFREGHVYCFHTGSPESPYSSPPHPTDVFAGYAPNGKPEWVSFANLCLARQEPRVDRLYGDNPEVLALVVGPGELDEGLLPGFGRDSLAYRLLGQVVVGLVPRDLNPRSRTERVALTLQLVETSQVGQLHRLRLNVIGLPVEAIAEAAADADETSPAEAFRKVLRATRGRVDALGRRAALASRRAERLDLEPLVMQLLTRLRGDVLRVLKSRDYRTRHAEERHQSGERPTALAIADALAAGDGRFFRDEHKNTVVVLGPKNRVHVFTTLGKHVTSLELLPVEVERRLELRRWRFLERPGSELFKDTLKRSLEARDTPA